MAYEAKLPDGVVLPAGASINTEHPDFKALVGLAEREGLSQKQFSAALGFETERAMRKATPAPAAPPPPPAPKVNFDALSTTQKFAQAFTTPSYRGQR